MDPESNSQEALKQVMKEHYSKSTDYHYHPRFYNRPWVRRIVVLILLIILMYFLYKLIV